MIHKCYFFMAVFLEPSAVTFEILNFEMKNAQVNITTQDNQLGKYNTSKYSAYNQESI